MKAINGDIYPVSAKQLEKVYKKQDSLPSQKKIRLALTVTDSSWLFAYPTGLFPGKKMIVRETSSLEFTKYSFDIDITNLPFKEHTWWRVFYLG